MRKPLVSCGLADAAARAHTHGGHGPEGAHRHATDLRSFLMQGAIVASVLHARRDN